MTIGQRINARRGAIGISQAELARRASVPQSTMNGLIHSDYRWSPHLVRIAQALRTSVAYLTGDNEDPEALEPLPPQQPAGQPVQMTVMLPPEAALARMFLGIIEASPRMSKVELANELAKHLPTGLALLRGPLTFEDQPDDLDAADAQAEDQHDDRPARRRA